MIFLKTGISLFVLILSLNTFGDCGRTVVASDCTETVILKDVNDLNTFLSSSKKANIIFDFNYVGTRFDLNSSCKIKFNPRSSIKVDSEICISGTDVDASVSVSMSSKKISLLSKEKISLRNSVQLNAEDIVVEGELIETFNKGELKAKRALINAETCKFHKETVINFNEKFGSCYGTEQIVLQLEASPIEGTSPLVVSFRNKSLGIFDEEKIVFGDGGASNEKEPVHTYVQSGAYEAYLSVRKNDQVYTSSKININVLNPITEDFEILYVMARVNPATILVNTHIKNDLESGTKEALWDFGDLSNTVIPFKLDNIGGTFHQYKEDGIYTLQLRLRGNDDYVTAPIIKTIDTKNQYLPVPRYSISSFKGDAPFTVQVEALQKFDEDGVKNRFKWTFTDKNQTLPAGDIDKVEYTFATPGFHRILLTVYDSKEAARTVTIPVYVGQQNSIPSLPPFPVIETSFRGGTAPFKVDFSAANSFDPDGLQGQPLSYEWSFFDPHKNQNILITGIGMSYEFMGSGYYSVRLTVTDLTGQRGVTTIPIMINGTMLSNSTFHVRAVGDPKTIEIDMSELMVRGDYIPDDTYYDYGDGTLSFGRTHTYQAAGTYKLKIVTRKIDSSFETFERTLRISDSGYPFVSITPTSYKFNINTSVTFSANMPEDIIPTTMFRWNLGDGHIISGTGKDFSKIEYIYKKSGSKQVVLDVILDSGISRRTGVLLQENKTPYFISEIIPSYNDGPSSPAKVGFAVFPATRDDDGYIKTYIYDWGDGSSIESSNQGYAEHVFLNPGIYNVKVTIVDENEAFAVQHVVVNIAANKNPVISDLKVYRNENEGAPVRIGFAPYESSFDEDGFIAQWIYDFGDGSPVITTDQGYLEHTFEKAGNYSVKIKAIDNKKGVGEVEALIVVKENQAPIIGEIKIYGNTNEPAPVKLGFAPHENSSDLDGFIVKWIYDFGDGTAPIETNEGYFEHIYQDPGTYIVIITAFDNKGAFSRREKILIINENRLPVIGDLMIYRNINEPAPVKIAFDTFPTSYDPDGYITNIRYDFGDGTIVESSLSYQEHLYLEPGIYYVTVSLTDNKQAVSSREFTLNVKQNIAPNITLKSYVISDVAPGKIGFEAVGLDSDGYIKNYIFDFGDGQEEFVANNYYERIFPLPGSYHVKVKAIDDKGAESNTAFTTITIKENISPIIISNVSYESLFAPARVRFDFNSSFDPDGNITRFNIDFDDGSSSGNATGIFEHVYNFPGNYTVLVSVVDDKGKTSATALSIDIINNILPVGLINLYPEIIYTGTKLKADAIGSLDPDGYIVSYVWDWGNGNTTGGIVSGNSYESPGIYLLKLNLQDNSGQVTEIQKTVIVLENNLPIAKISYQPSEDVLQFAQITFDASSSFDLEGSIVSYEWQFNDQEVLNGYKVPYFFKNEGLNKVKLTVKDAQGAEAVEVIEIETLPSEELPVPKILITSNSYIVNSHFQLMGLAEPIPGTEIISYVWNMGDGSEEIHKQSFFYNYQTPGDYNVSLKVTDSSGNINTVTRVIRVLPDNESFSTSPILISLLNIDVRKFNPLLNKIMLSSSSEILEINDIVFNGLQVLDYDLNQNSLNINAPFQDGKNVLTIIGQTIDNGTFEREYIFYAGSKTISLTSNDIIETLTFKVVDDSGFEFDAIKLNSTTYQVNNVPLLDLFLISESKEMIIHGSLVTSIETMEDINFLDIVEPNASNISFQSGLEGWVSKNSSTQVIPVAEGNNRAVMQINQTGEGYLVSKFTSSEPSHFAMNYSASGYDKDSIVFTAFKNETGLKYNIRRLSTGDYDPITRKFKVPLNTLGMAVSAGTPMTTFLGLYSRNTVQTSFLNGLIDNAFAETNVPIELNLIIKPVSFIVDKFDVYSSNVYFYSKDRISYYNNKPVCFLGLGQGINDGLDVTSRLNISADFRGYPGSSLIVLGVVAEDSSGSLIAFYESNIGKERTINGESCTLPNPQGNGLGCEYRDYVNETFERDILKEPLASNFIAKYISPVTPQGSIRLKLLTVEKTIYDEAEITTDKLIQNNFYRLLSESGTIQSTEYQFSCGTDNKIIPLYFQGNGYPRYNLAHDQETIGGDSWAQKYVIDLLQGELFGKIAINDIALMNGGTFEPHKSHGKGTAVDFNLNNFIQDLTVSNNKKAIKITYSSLKKLSSILSPIHSSVKSVLISYFKLSKDGDLLFSALEKQIPNYNHLQETTCVANRKLKSIITNDDKLGHLNHWHLDLDPTFKISQDDIPAEPLFQGVNIDYDNNEISFDFQEGHHLDIFTHSYDPYLNRFEEKKLFQSGTGISNFTCKDGRHLETGNFVQEMSWCNDWKFFEKAVISKNRFSLKLSEAEFDENFEKISSLNIRLVNFNNEYCSVNELKFIANGKCSTPFNENIIFRRHSNGGGLVADGPSSDLKASISKEVFVGADAVVCPGAVISGPVFIDGNVLIDNKVHITGDVSIANYEPIITRINGRSGAVYITPVTGAVEIFGEWIEIYGNVKIISPVNIGRRVALSNNQFNKNIKIQGTCNTTPFISGGSRILGNTTLENCFNVISATVENSTVIAPDKPDSFGQFFLEFIGNVGVVDSTVTGNVGVFYGGTVRDSKVHGTDRVVFSGYPRFLRIESGDVESKSEVTGNLVVEGRIISSKSNAFTSSTYQSYVHQYGTVMGPGGYLEGYSKVYTGTLTMPLINSTFNGVTVEPNK